MFDREFYHSGTPQPYPMAPTGSGRYRLGSGDDSEYKTAKNFKDTVDKLKESGITDSTELAYAMGMSTSEWREKNSISKDQIRKYTQSRGQALVDSGMSVSAAARELGLKNESTLRNLLKDTSKERAKATDNVVTVLKESTDKKGYIDVGKGVESYLGVSRTKLNTAVKKLTDQGYKKYYIKTQQLGTNNETTIQVLAKPDTSWKEVNDNREKIDLPFTHQLADKGRTLLGIEYPSSISSDRIQICYAEEGGIKKDGVIELRRGLNDLNLGESNYAQVRIAVDGTHYLKGMAMYRDDMPKGVDVIFNTNKHVGTDKMDVLKQLKVNKSTGEIDKDNPFGATIRRQMHYTDENGKDQLSPVNIVNEEGSWDEWSKTLSSQFLSKQNLVLVKQQLTKTYNDRASEFEELKTLTNPTVKQYLLDEFADNCDAAAVHLKAAALPRQRAQVILPVPSMKDNEIYAPNFKNGESVVLIRYPHGGTFEIPHLTVNNNQPDAKKALGNAKDAVGINEKVAERLSGADFDGDTVTVIPTSGQKLKYSKTSLAGLKDFDPKERYPYYEGMKVISPEYKQKQMGVVSNLITDMTIKGATEAELAAAVRHSMVVIDAEKHKLDWKRSYNENGIKALQDKYQDGGGASTLISKASSEQRVLKRKEITSTSTMTAEELKRWKKGEKIYRDTGESYTKTTKSGKQITTYPTIPSTKMAEATDAKTLSSGYPVENLYAEYANNLKAMANQARAISRSTTPIQRVSSAAKTYAEEVKQLKADLQLAMRNKPIERQAQLLGNYIVECKKKDNPYMDKDDLKKTKNQALAEARSRLGAKKYNINVTDKQWTAIQSGAVSPSVLKEILDNTDSDRIKQLATPRQTKLMTSSKIATAKSMLAKGRTIAEVADHLGVSISTLNRSLA